MNKFTLKRDILSFLVLAFCLLNYNMTGQKPPKSEIRGLIHKTLFALKNHDTVEFKRLFTNVPQSMTSVFFLSQLDIVLPQFSSILNRDLSIYKIETNDISDVVYRNQNKKKNPQAYQINVFFKLSQNSFKGLSFRMKKEADIWLYDGRYDLITLSGTHYLWCSRNEIKCDTIMDRITGNKFFLDQEHIWITAINKEGKLLWKTRPNSAFDNEPELKSYRTDNPCIVYFSFNRVWGDKTLSGISVGYNNSQSWRLNQETGLCEFMGQD